MQSENLRPRLTLRREEFYQASLHCGASVLLAVGLFLQGWPAPGAVVVWNGDDPELDHNLGKSPLHEH